MMLSLVEIGPVVLEQKAMSEKMSTTTAKNGQKLGSVDPKVTDSLKMLMDICIKIDLLALPFFSISFLI